METGRSERRFSVQPRNAGRDFFKRAASLADGDLDAEELDMEALRKHENAIRSFTESVEMDFPPPPELPSSLDIDCYENTYGARMKESSTIDTIIEVGKLHEEEKPPTVDPKLGETQKYKMSVPGPEKVDEEFELHKSLLREDEQLDDEEAPYLPQTSEVRRKRPENVCNESDQDALRQRYNQAAVQRPRATTPTSWSVIDAYVREQEEGGREEERLEKRRKIREQGPPDAGAKIRVSIPNAKTGTSKVSRRSSIPWSDFYESMEQQRSRSSSRQGSVDFDFDQEWVRQSSVSQEPTWTDPESEKWNGNQGMSAEQADAAPTADRRTSRTSQGSAADHLPREARGESPKSAETNGGPPQLAQGGAEGGAVPVRAAPPPPPGKKKRPEAQVVPQEPAFAAPDPYAASYSSAAYGSDAYAGYDASGQPYEAGAYYAQGYEYAAYQADYGNYEQSAYAYGSASYGYGQTYDPNAAYGQSAAVASGEHQYDQSATHQYDQSTAQQYDQSAAQQYQAAYDAAHYEQSAAYAADGAAFDAQPYYAADYDPATYGAYDPTAYNAGYDQYGAHSTAVGAEQTTTRLAAACSAGYDQAEGERTSAVGAEQTTTALAAALTSGYDQGGLRTSAVGAEDAAGTSDEDALSTASGLEPRAPAAAHYDYGGAHAPSAVDLPAAEVTVTDTSQPTGTAHSSDYAHHAAPTTTYDPAAYDAAPTTTYDPAAYDAAPPTTYDPAADDAAPTTTYDPAAYDAAAYSQYGTTASYDTTAYGSYDDYGAYGAHTEESQAPPPPPPPVFARPLLPQPPPKEADPFSWEAQETSGGLPPPRPPPARTPEPDFDQLQKEELTVETKEAPPRPGPPSGGKPAPPRPAPPPASPAQKPAMPPPPRPAQPEQEKEEEDPWARFKQMSEAVGSAVKSTEAQLKTLSETSAAKEIKDESYVGQIGGTQQFELTSAQKQILKMQEEKKKAKADKKAAKVVAKKKRDKVGFDPMKEEDMEKKAAELVARIAANRADLQESSSPSVQDGQTPEEEEVEEEEEQEEKEEQQEAVVPEVVQAESPAKEPEAAPAADLVPEGWAAFSVPDPTALPSSESDFFSQAAATAKPDDAFGGTDASADATQSAADPFAPSAFSANVFDTDLFDTRPIDEIMEEARRKAESQLAHLDEAGAVVDGRLSVASTPTEGASPMPDRPDGFADEFQADAYRTHTPTPLYDEDDSAPLEDFFPKFAGEGWELMVRHPLKKKNFMQERCWKPCFVRIEDNMMRIFNSKEDRTPILEILLQASYSLSDCTLQAYDAYGKIHTVKLQHVMYKERVGIRAGQISRLVEGHVTKYGLPLEHAAQVNVLAKFAALDNAVLETFVNSIEDILFRCAAKRDAAPAYKQDEVQIHCHDEYSAHVDKLGNVSGQRARVRMFCLSFLSGSPHLEIGLNDRRREGKEIVRRKDILPMYTERWIRFEGMEFHSSVDPAAWEEEQVVKVTPPDACFFEVLRFRVRPPRNREKPLSVKSIMKIAGSKIEIRIDVMAAAQQQRARGTVESTRTIPCEDIQIRFPIPEAWIYIFREERTWGVGSVHSRTRRTGKMKNLKDRLMGSVAAAEPTLIEVATGEAKYEHVHRSLVWRIPRLPEKHQQAYKQHLLKCRFGLSSFDLMPEEFRPSAQVQFTMPLATISNTVVRSVSVEQHEDSDRVEKFVRYVAKCHYDLDIDYVQCNTLDDDTDVHLGYEVQDHKPMFNPDEVKAQQEGYGVQYTEEQVAKMKEEEAERQAAGLAPAEPFATPPTTTSTTTTTSQPAAQNPFGGSDFERYAMQGLGNGTGFGRQDSSSDEEAGQDAKFPAIKIDMQGYGYGY